MQSLLINLSNWLHPYLGFVANAVVATLLVLLGNTINKQVKKLTRTWFFLLRYLAFILLCTFGYGLMTQFLVPLVLDFLASLNRVYLAPVVLTSLLGLGLWAERSA